MRNPERPTIDGLPPDSFFTASDGARLFFHVRDPGPRSRASVYVISGYTGINHESERDVIDLLCDGSNRIVVLHPRGTGHSEGKRGDVGSFSRFLADFTEFIAADTRDRAAGKAILYGHSISAAMALEIGLRLRGVDGGILVNPPFVMKPAPGMTPSLFDYARYAAFMLFAPHVPVVDMSGDPSRIENEADRNEARARAVDPLLVKYVSMYMMLSSKRVLDRMAENAERSDYPLLLIRGTEDGIVDEKGCAAIFDSWKHPRKEYRSIENGSHGKSTVILAKRAILSWIRALPDRVA